MQENPIWLDKFVINAEELVVFGKRSHCKTESVPVKKRKGDPSRFDELIESQQCNVVLDLIDQNLLGRDFQIENLVSDDNFQDLFEHAIIENRSDSVKSLMAASHVSLDIHIQGQPILHYLIQKQFTFIALELIHSGRINLDALAKAYDGTYYSALTLAIKRGFDEIAYALINTGANACIGTLTSIHMALDLKNIPIALALIEKTNMNAINANAISTLLKHSILGGCLEVSTALLEKYGAEFFAGESRICDQKFYAFIEKLAAGEFKHSKPDVNQIILCMLALEQLNKINPSNVILNLEELPLYCWLLKSSGCSSKGDFIIYGEHWSSGQINFESSDKIDLFLNDSVPKMFSVSNLYFLNKIFPERQVNVYYPNKQEPRQNAAKGCSFFALNSSIQLSKQNLYLPKRYGNDLFQYLSENIISTFNYENIAFHECNLPLYLLKDMQSKKLYTQVIPSRSQEEQLTPVTKSNFAPLVACKENFKLLDDNLFNHKSLDQFTKLKDITNKLSKESSNDKLFNLAQNKTLHGFALSVDLKNGFQQKTTTLITTNLTEPSVILSARPEKRTEIKTDKLAEPNRIVRRKLLF